MANLIRLRMGPSLPLILILLILSLPPHCFSIILDQHHVVPLPSSSSPYTAFCLFRPPFSSLNIAAGHKNGSIDLIELTTANRTSIIAHSSVLRNSVNSLIAHEGHLLANDAEIAVRMDAKLNIVQKWQSSHQIRGLTVSQSAQGETFLGMLQDHQVEEVAFSDGSKGQRTLYDGFSIRAHLAQYSSKHSHLYIVNEQRQQLVVFDLSKEHTFRVKEEGQDVEIRRKGEVVMQRRFSFRIRDVMADHKDENLGDEARLMLVTEQGVVYHTNRGKIVTFLPYSRSQQAELLAWTFCQHTFFLTLHRQDGLLFLTLFRKDTFLTQQVLNISQAAGAGGEVLGVDCNFGHAAVMMQKRVFLFRVEEEKEKERGQYWQMALTFVLLAAFILCCRQSGRQNDGHPHQEQEMRQDEEERRQDGEEQPNEDQKSRRGRNSKEQKIRKAREQVVESRMQPPQRRKRKAF